MIKITLKDGSVKEYEQGITVGDVAKDLSMGLFRKTAKRRFGTPPPT